MEDASLGGAVTEGREPTLRSCSASSVQGGSTRTYIFHAPNIASNHAPGLCVLLLDHTAELAEHDLDVVVRHSRLT